jgi:hypothetical protein
LPRTRTKVWPPEPTPGRVRDASARRWRYLAPVLTTPRVLSVRQQASLLVCFAPLLQRIEAAAEAASDQRGEPPRAYYARWSARERVIAVNDHVSIPVRLDGGTSAKLGPSTVPFLRQEVQAIVWREECWAQFLWIDGEVFAWNVTGLWCHAIQEAVESGTGNFLLAGLPAVAARRRLSDHDDPVFAAEERKSAQVSAMVRASLDASGPRIDVPTEGLLIRNGCNWVRSGKGPIEEGRPWQFFDEDLGLSKNAPFAADAETTDDEPSCPHDDHGLTRLTILSDADLAAGRLGSTHYAPVRYAVRSRRSTLEKSIKVAYAGGIAQRMRCPEATGSDESDLAAIDRCAEHMRPSPSRRELEALRISTSALLHEHWGAVEAVVGRAAAARDSPGEPAFLTGGELRAVIGAAIHAKRGKEEPAT